MNGKDESKMDDDVMAQAAKLATAVRPERDLWPEIEQAITAPARTKRTVWNSLGQNWTIADASHRLSTSGPKKPSS